MRGKISSCLAPSIHFPTENTRDERRRKDSSLRSLFIVYIRLPSLPLRLYLCPRLLQRKMRSNLPNRDYFNFVPAGTDSSARTIVGLPSLLVAMSIMPCDVIPKSSRGLRLSTNTVLIPMSSSGV